MNMRGIHFLLSYTCNGECDHCFLWCSPWATGAMTLDQVRRVLRQAADLGTVDMVYFEGGEPFLFYPIMLQGLREARALGFKTGVVTNNYWATSVEDAVVWLEPLAQIGLDDLSLSSDLYHGEAMLTQTARNAREGAVRLGLPADLLMVAPPGGGAPQEPGAKGEPIEGGPVRYRGRAAVKLTESVPHWPWREFTACPDEDFLNPSRVHVDTFGHVHLCQGLLMGNLWQQTLSELAASYDPIHHPVLGPLIEGGPAALVERYDLPFKGAYADACHLCYLARKALRARFPEVLAPPVVYGE